MSRLGVSKLLTTLEAKELCKKSQLLGYPPEDKFLVAIPDGDGHTTKGGLIIPGTADEALPKKGVLIDKGSLSSEYTRYRHLSCGTIITFGLYAGKEIDFHFEDITPEGYKLTVLSAAEILFIEHNN